MGRGKGGLSSSDYCPLFVQVMDTHPLAYFLNALTIYQTTIFLDWSKSKALADDKINVAEMMIPLSDRVENIVGKGENTGYQHCLLFPQCF